MTVNISYFTALITTPFILAVCLGVNPGVVTLSGVTALAGMFVAWQTSGAAKDMALERDKAWPLVIWLLCFFALMVLPYGVVTYLYFGV